jgi:hypothetical protein
MAKQTIDLRPAQSIHLTAAQSGPRAGMTVHISHLLTYAEETGFTRLRLVGGRVLDVKETTDQIDQLVRSAATRSAPAAPTWQTIPR